MKILALVLVSLLLGSSVLPGAHAQAPGASPTGAPAAGGADDTWPKQIVRDGNLFSIYQPQIERWGGNELQARAAVALQTASAPEARFGVFWFSARTDVDKESRMVRLEDLSLFRIDFPGTPDDGIDYASALNDALPSQPIQIALDRLQANLEVTQVIGRQPQVAVKNTPPRIVYSPRLAVLVLTDGKPVLRPVQGTPLLRAINTRALLLLDPSSGTYYLWLLTRWVQAPALEGPWTAATRAPAALETAKEQAVAAKQVSLDDFTSPVRQALEQGQLPVIYVSTAPTELIQTEGPAQYQPIAPTQVFEVSNTASSLFFHRTAQQYFVLLSGRWFRARALGGPWAFVEPRTLPGDFAQIPLTHPRGAVLASVPGTPEAKQAVIANGIPQTATIARTARLTVVYDGPPQFAPITGTGLSYAVNASLPVIQVDRAYYLALQDGVWFVASSPTRAWLVATSVPPVVYTIPPTSPLYYATHVYVYGSTSQVVYTGYTPGYYGMVVSPSRLVVYGTGYVYPAWVGAVWYPPPATYGVYAAGYGAGVFTGFAFGMAFGAIAASAPWGWHGGCCWGGWHGGYANLNIYTRYGDKYYRAGSGAPGPVGNAQFARAQDTALARQGNNVYATHDGNVYRKTGGGWQHYDSSTNSWNNVNSSPAQQRAQQAQREYQSSPWAQQARSQYLAGGTPPGGGWQEPARGYGGGPQYGGGLDAAASARAAGQDRYSAYGSGGGFGERFGGFRR
jgi:hypothetical protein